ncbi:MAG TPA: aminotransferase class V-fold PLP-dependent enzyme, partial [Cellvibrio sp.]|nr:aminotransferase class V-fold PLP-dependent enzyme [Cellvibrio sp.]
MSEHPGLPDLQSLAAMANEIFQSLPTAALPIVSGLQPNIPAAGFANGQQRPQLGRTSETPSFTSPTLEQHSAAVPAPTYYFADNASNYPLANLQLDQLTGQVSPHAFGLPDENDLRDLLADNRFITSAPAKPQSGAALKPMHHLESSAGDYHHPQVGSDRVSPSASHLPGEPDIQQLLAAEFRFRKFDAPAPASSPAPDSRFYFLDSGVQPVFGNTPKQAQFAAENSGFDIQAIRRDFPILAERVNGKPLVWFDNAATTQKPKSVIERVSYFYEHENSNIHRAAHELAARATDAYEGARNKVARFIGARSPDDIIFVRGATEGINLLANTFGQQQVGEGDEIIVSQLEHHANIVPWYMLAKRVGATLR